MMWKRDEAIRSQTRPAAARFTPDAHSDAESMPGAPSDLAVIGRSVAVDGYIEGSEHLAIQGQVSGAIQLRNHTLTIGPHAHVNARVLASTVIVRGALTGDVVASEKVSILEGGSVDGDIFAPRVAIADGAYFRGRVHAQHARPDWLHSRMPVEVHVPMEDDGADENATALELAVTELLETFDFQPEEHGMFRGGLDAGARQANIPRRIP